MNKNRGPVVTVVLWCRPRGNPRYIVSNRKCQSENGRPAISGVMAHTSGLQKVLGMGKQPMSAHAQMQIPRIDLEGGVMGE